MGIAELLIGKISDVFGVAAGFVAVTGIREQGMHHHPAADTVRRGESALHLVEDDTLIDRRFIHIVQFVMPALLIEDIRVLQDQRMEDGVKIDAHQIDEILIIAGTDRINSLIRIGHRVQEGLQGSFQKIDERFSYRITGRAVENGMFKDVEDTGVIDRSRFECDRERLVFVVSL